MTEIWKDVQIVYSLSSMQSSFFNVVVEILYMFSTFQSENIVFVQCSSISLKKKCFQNLSQSSYAKLPF